MPYVSEEKEREFQRQYHLKTWSKRKVRHKELKSIRRTNLAIWLKAYKKDLVCINCKESHPACLDFHHKNSKEKENTVANMISEGYAIIKIIREIDKCIVLCKNCHARKHFNSKTIC